MNEFEQRKNRRLRFLRAVYDLAEGTPSREVRGEDVAQRLDIDLNGQDFHELAYYHEKAQNTKALEHMWGLITITVEGIREVESTMTPESRLEKRIRFLRTIYDLSDGNSAVFVEWHDVAPRLGWSKRDGAHLDKAIGIAEYLERSALITIEVDEGTVYKITEKGIDEVEENRPQTSGSTTNFNFNAPVHGSVIGTNNTAELTNNFDFRAIEQRIEREGGEDKEELCEALAEIRGLLESGQSLDRGALSKFSGVMERHSWFTGSVAQGLIGFATQIMSG